MADDDIVLSELADDELVLQMHDDLYDGLKDEITEGTNILLERGWTPYDVLTKALVEGMRIVGEDFRDGILFVPEVLLSANAMKAGMFILRPLLAETGAPKMGKMVIGTVKGDIHDIGKNLVGMMMEGAGFDVVDLGINNPVENYLDAIEEHQPDIVGMSALLTTTMPYMKVVIDTLVEKGMRDDYIVLVGGAPLNDEFGAGNRRRRLLPRRRRGRRDGQGDGRPQAQPAAGGLSAGRSSAMARLTVIACGALAREILDICRLDGLDHVDLRCLPAGQPAQPAGAYRAPGRGGDPRGEGAGAEDILVAYGDCGTGGELARVVKRHGATMLPGAHCYAFFEGVEAFAARRDAGEIDAFYLTDFLARHFEAFVVRPLKLREHPELMDMMFAHYTRVVHQVQAPDAGTAASARAAADFLGLPLETRHTGYGALRTTLARTGSARRG